MYIHQAEVGKKEKKYIQDPQECYMVSSTERRRDIDSICMKKKCCVHRTRKSPISHALHCSLFAVVAVCYIYIRLKVLFIAEVLIPHFVDEGIGDKTKMVDILKIVCWLEMNVVTSGCK